MKGAETPARQRSSAVKARCHSCPLSLNSLSVFGGCWSHVFDVDPHGKFALFHQIDLPRDLNAIKGFEIGRENLEASDVGLNQ
jgi:hypothetical protein